MISFLLGPSGRVIMLVVAFLGWTVYQRHDAAGTERDRLTLQYEKAESAEVSRQAAASAASLAAAAARAEASEKRSLELQGIADELENDLSKDGVTCGIPDDLRKRLLKIR